MVYVMYFQMIRLCIETHLVHGQSSIPNLFLSYLTIFSLFVLLGYAPLRIQGSILQILQMLFEPLVSLACALQANDITNTFFADVETQSTTRFL